MQRGRRPDTRVNLISEETMRNLYEFLEYLDRKTASDCQMMVTLWFDEAASRQIVLDHLDAVSLGRIRRHPGSTDWKPTFDLYCEFKDTDVGAGGRPAEVPGMLLWLRREFLRQLGRIQDKLREKG